MKMYLCTGNNTTPIIMPSPERQDYESPFFNQCARRKVGVQLARKKLASVGSIPYLCHRISITDPNRLPMYMQTSTYQQEDHYYPYGGLMGESTGGDVQRYKYNGKELNRMHGLDWYDYGSLITALGISGEELTFVGHSLGGALAALSSKLTGKDAITFNPASLTGEIKTLASVVSLFRGGHITQYRAVGNGFFGGLLGDPVNTIQNLTRRSSQGKVIPVYVGSNFSHSIKDIIAAFHRNGIR